MDAPRLQRPMVERGKLIVFCGVDGSGKTTQELLLAAALRAAGHSVVCTKQPTEWYRSHPEVRRFLDTGACNLTAESIALLAAADRKIHLDTVIEPTLAQGVHVISNRYVYSSHAYFGARGVDPRFICEINACARNPDLGILLRIDPTAAIERVAKRGEAVKFEERDASYMRTVQNGLLRAWPSGFLIIDAGQPAHYIAEFVRHYVLPELTRGSMQHSDEATRASRSASS